MHSRTSHPARTLATAVVIALGLAACGGTDDPDLAASASDVRSMSDGDVGDMDMGSTDGVRADQVDDATLRQSDFVLLDSAPAGFEDAGGTAHLALGEMTWATIDLTGLPAGTAVVAHLHAEDCANDGGPHFRFDPDGGDTPPNEVHLSGEADEDGSLTVSVTNEQVADGAASMVFHQRDGDTTKVACADLPAG